MTPSRWLGIDFSGSAPKWRAGCRTSNVWIADLREGADGLALAALSRLQDLAMRAARPFEWLCHALAEGQFAAAAIDAPFSVPARFAGTSGHAGLVARVGNATPPAGRPFLWGADFVRLVTGLDPPILPKPYRVTEQHWRDSKVETRSTLWVKPRGGAPMAAACLRLLHLAKRPVWPWSQTGGGLLVEGFPAAQLCQWGLKHEEYSGADDAARAARRCIVGALKTRVGFSPDAGQQMLASADALDAVLCAFAAIAVTNGSVAHPPAAEAHVEGWIAVHL